MRHLQALRLPLLAALLLSATSVQAQSYNLQGYVKNARGAGIGGVTIDLYDPVANTRATAVQNISLATGQFSAFFTPTDPAATLFYVDFAPPGGTGYAAVQLKDQRLSGPVTAMPDTILPDAVQLTVTVFDTAGTLPQPGVDLDAYDATTGAKVYTPGATTGALGDVTVDVPPGVYDLLLTPPRAGPLGAADLYMQRVTTAATLNVNLPAGTMLSGTVTDSLGAPLDRAPLSISDPLTGRAVASRYNTAGGAFSFFLAPGTYDVTVEPPAGLDLMPVRRSAVLLPGAPLSVVLPAATPIIGRVVDGAARPQYQARLSVEDAFTGLGVDTYRARVDSTGALRLNLLPGTYDITVLPPPGSSLVAKTLPHVVVGTSLLDLGTITLDAGFVVTGRVTGGGQPVPDVNVNTYDSRTGHAVATSRDHADANGNFRIVVPAGTYDLDFLPPVATTWLDQVRPAVAVTGNLALTPDVVLVAGARVTATVEGQGAGPLEGASLHLIDPVTLVDVPLAHQSSCSTGAVDFNVAAGTYVLQVLPPAGTSWMPLERPGVVITGPTTALGTLTLVPGSLLEGNVKALAAPNAPIDDVNVNLYQAGTTVQVLTARDHSDFQGHFAVAAAPGTYDVELRPPLGTRYLPRTLPSTTLTPAGVVLPDTLLAEGVLVAARTIDAATSAGIADVQLQFTDTSTGAPSAAAHDRSAFDGRIEAAVAAGTYVVQAVPASGMRYTAATLTPGAIAGDTNLGDIRLSRGFLVGGTVRSVSAQPIAGVVVTARVAGSGTPQPLARNVTDAAGVADGMVLPAGTFDLTFTPPPASPYIARTIAGVAVSADDHALFAVTLDAVTVTSVTPATGTTRGGVPVTVNGTGFSGATPQVLFGGMPLLSPVIASPTTITGTLPAHPSGLVDVEVTLSTGARAMRARAFTYQSPAPVELRVSRIGAAGLPTNDVTLSWTPAGQPDYVVYRALDTPTFGPGSVARTVSAPTTTFTGEIGDRRLVFYSVE